MDWPAVRAGFPILPLCSHDIIQGGAVRVTFAFFTWPSHGPSVLNALPDGLDYTHLSPRPEPHRKAQHHRR